MSILKKIKDKTGTIHDLGDSRVDAFETELSGAEHNVPYSPAVLAKTNAIEASVSAHIRNTANPHEVTKAQVGLANVENKSSTQIRSELTKENVTNALGYTPIDESRIGAANGVASLDASGRIPASQIPGGFDNIEEYDNLAAFPTTGEEGKIYVAKDTNLTYRWTGSQYVEISPSLALGETATTAYRGDRGKVAYDHSQVSGNSTIHHTHANKELLDSYKQTEADLANAVAKVHEHGNKGVLDGITSDKVNSWDGKEDAFDVLPTTKGGTGTNAASKSALTSTLINSLSAETSTPKDADYYVSQHVGGGTTNTTYYRRPVSALWNYIKGKIESVLGLTASDYAGKASTAGTADKAGKDDDGNVIKNTYQKKLTFDTTPTAGSTNPVTSDGVAKVNGYRKLFTQGHSSSTVADSIILFYIKWKSPNDSGIYNRQYEIKYNNYKTGNGGIIRLSPNINNTTGGTLNLVSDRFNFNDLNFGVIEAPDGDSNHPYWFVCYGYGVGGSIEIIQNGRNLTYTDRPVVVPEERILTSSCNFTKNYSQNPKYYTYTIYPSTTGTFVLKSIDGKIKWDSNLQSMLTFDTTPTAGSTNPVTSEGIKTALEVLQSNIDSVDAKGIVINEINGENVICFE